MNYSAFISLCIGLVIICGVTVVTDKEFVELKTELTETSKAKELEVRVDFDYASTACDIRYGVNNIESVKCLNEVISYFEESPVLKASVIEDFCFRSYVVSKAVKSCSKDLKSLMYATKQHKEELYEGFSSI